VAGEHGDVFDGLGGEVGGVQPDNGGIGVIRKKLFEKILNEFTALARSGRLVSKDNHEAERRNRIRYIIDCPDNQPWLSIDVEKYNRIVPPLEQAFPKQLADKQVQELVVAVVRPLLDAGKEDFKPIDIKDGLAERLSIVEGELQEYTMMLIVDGLTMKHPCEVRLGSLSLHPYQEGTGYAQILQAEQERRKKEIIVKLPYLKFQRKGNIDRLTAVANEEAGIALSIFRLFNASWHGDKNPPLGSPKRIGVYIASERDVRNIHTINSDGVYIASHMTPQHFEPFVLDENKIKSMELLGLDTINQLMSDSTSDDNDKSRRIRYAIHWFAKGTDAETLTDSFLMYAIAAEALLSEGRTSQEIYAQRIAGLLARDRQYRTGPFSGQLPEPQKPFDPNAWFITIRARIVELFDFRNRIAHGSETSGEAQHISNLVDFESCTRGAILSFASGPWQSITEYSEWLDSSLTTVFEP